MYVHVNGVCGELTHSHTHTQTQTQTMIKIQIQTQTQTQTQTHTLKHSGTVSGKIQQRDKGGHKHT